MYESSPTSPESHSSQPLLIEQSLGGLPIYQERLPSTGIELVYIQKPGPFVATAAFNGGSRFDTVPGIAHALEHTISTGTEKFERKSEIGSYLDPYGGRYYASTGPQFMTFTVDVGRGAYADQAITALTDVIARPQFDRQKMVTELGTVMNEVVRKATNPEAMVFEVWRRLFFQGTDLGHHNIGTPNDIAILQAHPELIVDYWTNLMAPGRLAFVACGDVPFRDIMAKFDEQIPGYPGPPAPFANLGELPVIRNTAIDVYTEGAVGKTVHAMFGFRVPGVETADAAVLTVIESVMGSGANSRFLKALREEKGLVDSIQSAAYLYTGAGTFTARTNAPREKLQQVIDELCEQIALLRDRGVSIDELQFHKDRLVNSLALSAERAASLTSAYGGAMLGTNSLSTDESVRRISTVSSEDIQRVAQTYFTDDRWYLALAGDIDPGMLSVHIPSHVQTADSKNKPEPTASRALPHGVPEVTPTVEKQTPVFESLEAQSAARTEARLPGGTRLIMYERSGPFSITTLAHAGLRYEPEQRHGVAGMFGRMLPAATEHFAARSELAAYLERYGGRYGVSSNTERLTVNVIVGNMANAPRAITVLTELMTGATFDEKVLETERLARLNTLEQRKSDPEQRVRDAWHNLFFQDTPLAIPEGALEATTRSITSDDLRTYQKQVITPYNTLIVATGNGTADEVAKLFETHRDRLLALPRTQPLLPNYDVVSPSNARLIVDSQPNVNQTNIKLGFRTCGRDDPDAPALALISTMLTGSRSARLITGLKEHPSLAGLTYLVHTDLAYLEETGYFTVETHTQTETLRDVLDIITNEFQRLALGDITAEEVEKMKQYRLNQLPMRLETAGDWLAFHAGREFDRRGGLTEHINEIRGVTKEDIIRVAQKYFRPEALLVALSGNIPSGDEIYSLLGGA
ncbi:MAG TPA: pitrilysin family protein [Candidatus Saccharimonadales bacterium]|nr:pitrilysin family protein [Candidatus Saccharimonadales bacterium]